MLVQNQDSRQQRGQPLASPGSPKAGTKLSYRGLIDTLESTEVATSIWRAEEKAARSESRSLRSNLLRTKAENEESEAYHCNYTSELSDFHTEAAELWRAHEAPLREQEDALRSSLGYAAALEESQGAQDDGLSGLRQECQTLGMLGNTLQSEVAQGQRGHASIAEQVDRGQREVDALERRLDESETRAQELHGLAKARSSHRISLDAEATSEQLQMNSLHQALKDMERQHQSRIAGWMKDTATCCTSLSVQHRVWEAELEHGRQLLETHMRESSNWREQAYRQESALAALNGTDVANSIRSLAEECMSHCKANEANEPIHLIDGGAPIEMRSMPESGGREAGRRGGVAAGGPSQAANGGSGCRASFSSQADDVANRHQSAGSSQPANGGTMSRAFFTRQSDDGGSRSRAGGSSQPASSGHKSPCFSEEVDLGECRESQATATFGSEAKLGESRGQAGGRASGTMVELLSLADDGESRSQGGGSSQRANSGRKSSATFANDATDGGSRTHTGRSSQSANSGGRNKNVATFAAEADDGETIGQEAVGDNQQPPMGGSRGRARNTVMAYEILGASPEHRASVVKKNYRAELMKRHPDRGGSHDDFIDLQESADYIATKRKSVAEKLGRAAPSTERKEPGELGRKSVAA